MSSQKKEMTIAQMREQIRNYGCSLRIRDGEYRVCFKGLSEDCAYYTNDRQDAVDTAKAIYEAHNGLNQQ